MKNRPVIISQAVSAFTSNVALEKIFAVMGLFTLWFVLGSLNLG
jgi:hypothetical protein